MNKNYFKNLKVNSTVRSISILFCAFISLLSIVLNIDKVGSLPRLNIYHLFLLIFIYYFYDKFYFKGEKISKVNCIMSIFFSSIFVLGQSFMITNSLHLLIDGKIQILKTIIKFVGNYIIIYIVIKELYVYIERLANKNSANKNKFMSYVFEKSPNSCIVLILLLAWLPFMIIMYPGIISNDSAAQIWQVVGENASLNNHHPILSSLIMGKLVQLGQIIHCPDIGLFTYILLQVAFLMYTIVYSFKIMRKMKISNRVQLIILVFYALCPIIYLYVFNAIKDVAFAICLFYYLLMIIEMIIDAKVLEKKSYLIKFSVVIFLTFMFRHNGIYSIIPSGLLLILYLKRYKKSIIVCFVIPLILYESLTKIVYPILNIEPDTIRDMLSVPFQQTARTLYEGKEYEEKDLEIIGEVLDIEVIKEKYDPLLSDNVKGTFDPKTCTKNQLMNYFKVWLKYLTKYPLTYIEATLNNTYGYIYPNFIDTHIREYVRVPEQFKLVSDLSWKNIFTMQPYREIVGVVLVIEQNLPIIGNFMSPGSYNCILIISSIYTLILKKRREYSPIYVALLMLLLVCIASPFVALRYMLTSVYIAPIIIAINIYISKNKENEEIDLGGKE